MKKVVVISGASSGIGYCLAQELAKDGHMVYAGARKKSDVERLSQIENIQGVQLDITKTEDINNLVVLLEKQENHIDVLINNAGITGWGGIIDRDMDYYRNVLEVNLFGHIQMIKSCYMLLRHSVSMPIIINMSSQGGNYAMPFWSAYHTSKWGLEAFSHSLRRELQPFGIRVSIIQPGAIESDAFSKDTKAYEEFVDKVSSDFRRLTQKFLDAAFNRSATKSRNKSPMVIVNAVQHAISNKKNKIYYQPGKRFIPDWVMDKFPYWLVDKILAKM